MPVLTNMHARRLAALLEAVASCVSGPALSLTDVGERGRVSYDQYY